MDVTFSETEIYFSQPISTSPLPRESVGEELNWITILPDSAIESVLPSTEQVEVVEPSAIGGESLEPLTKVSVNTPVSTPAISSAITPYSLPIVSTHDSSSATEVSVAT
ncbi:hypothetical protein ACOSQ4_013077 [Xanthoceras sorbifolium]